MATPIQPGLTLYRSQLAASREWAAAMLHAMEKSEKLMLDSARQCLEDSMNFAEGLTVARDPEGFLTLQRTFFGRGSEAAIQCQKRLAEIISEAQSSCGQAIEKAFRGLQSGTEQASDQVSGGNGAVAVNWLPMWDTAFKEIANTTRQMMSAAETMSHPAKKAAPAIRKH